MARRGLKPGICHLCGKEAGLSFEHVPPRSAFNKENFLSPDFEAIIAQNDLRFIDEPSGKIVQGGAGSYTLCEACNRFTGRRYGNAYAEFANECSYFSFSNMEMQKFGGTFKLYPLRVLKQIISMFCSACGPGFVKAHPDVKEYVLNTENRQYPKGISIYIGVYHVPTSTLSRQSGITSSMDMVADKISVMSEICFPPFVLYADLSGNFNDRRFLNIDWFNNFDYAQKVRRYLMLNCLSVNSMLPYDYRTVSELRADFGSNNSSE